MKTMGQIVKWFFIAVGVIHAFSGLKTLILEVYNEYRRLEAKLAD